MIKLFNRELTPEEEIDRLTKKMTRDAFSYRKVLINYSK